MLHFFGINYILTFYQNKWVKEFIPEFPHVSKPYEWSSITFEFDRPSGIGIVDKSTKIHVPTEKLCGL